MGITVVAGFVQGVTMSAYADEKPHLTLGRITQEPGKNIDRLTAMAQYLDAKLSSDSISSVQIAIVDSREKMAEMLRNGEIDLFSETPLMALDLMEQGLAEPLVREWKNGAAEYHSVIVVRRDSGLRSLEDLRGRKFAFEDPGSTSGYLLPRAALEDAGLPLEELTDPRNIPTDGKLGYSFAMGEINVVAWVNRGLADAGAISNLDWDNPKKAPARLKDSLTVIHETPPVIRSMMMVRRTLDPEIKDRLASVLTQMHETSDGQTALNAYFKVSRYDPLNGQATTGLENARKVWRQPWNQNE